MARSITPPPLSRGLGIHSHEHSPPVIHADHDYDIHAGITDSPSKDAQSGRHHDSASSTLSPYNAATFSANGGLSPLSSQWSPVTPQPGASMDDAFQPMDSATSAEVNTNPFNFTPQQYTAGMGSNAGTSKSEALGRRKGHKYRHSSVHASHMDSIFQSPTLRTPLSLPASLPMPTRKEVWRSLTPAQTVRLTWCLVHFLSAACVQLLGASSLSLTALSRLLLFSTAHFAIRTIVDVMSNFEVWQRSTLRHPFGLQRADVLARFGLAVFLAFMGLDVLSHGVQHSLENLGTHVPHNAHAHTRPGAQAVYLAAALAAATSLISALLLRSTQRRTKPAEDGKPLESPLPTLRWWTGSITPRSLLPAAPSHYLTLTVSTAVLLPALPLLSDQMYPSIDLLLSLCVAGVMILLGYRLGTSQASMLLMSYRAPSTGHREPDSASDNGGDVVRAMVCEIEREPGVSAVQEARVWQVHGGLGMANLKVRYHDRLSATRLQQGGGRDDAMVALRERVMSLVRRRLGQARGVRWEVSVQMGLEAG